MSKSKRPLIIAGNWKMHNTRASSLELVAALVSGVKAEKDLPVVVVCPPFTCLEAVSSAMASTNLKVGAQNMDNHDQGAFTGEISPLMLKDLGVEYVIIGHSERRQFFGETNTTVNLKIKTALKHGLTPIVCVGETADEHEHQLTDAVVSRQTAAALDDLEAEQLKKLVLAYEPIWAIGTGKVCGAEDANRVASLIRSTIGNLYGRRDYAESIPVLYGGSVKASNIDEQLAQPDIDGVLVGGASLIADEFLAIIRSGQKQMRLAGART